MNSKVENRLVEKFLEEINGYLQDLNQELRDDLLREVRENLEARAEDPAADLDLPNSFDYANELRQAAGLQPLIAKSGVWGQLRAAAQNNKLLRTLGQQLRVFAPLFWIALGIGAFGFIDIYIFGEELFIGIPSDLDEWLVWGILVLTSMWLGTAKLSNRLRRFRNVVVALSLLPMGILLHGMSEGFVSTYQELRTGNFAKRTMGLINDGFPVTNIFPYDQNGVLLENVTLFDDLGRPLNSSAEELVTPAEAILGDNQLVTGYLSPNESVAGNAQWNVYPLKAALETGQFGRLRVIEPIRSTAK